MVVPNEKEVSGKGTVDNEARPMKVEIRMIVCVCVSEPSIVELYVYVWRMRWCIRGGQKNIELFLIDQQCHH